MQFYVGVTDKGWFDLFKANECYEVNFCKPGTSVFRALQPGGLFLFRLHSPNNYVVGGRFFASFPPPVLEATFTLQQRSASAIEKKDALCSRFFCSIIQIHVR